MSTVEPVSIEVLRTAAVPMTGCDRLAPDVGRLIGTRHASTSGDADAAR